jgi:hypothetical protein
MSLTNPHSSRSYSKTASYSILGGNMVLKLSRQADSILGVILIQTISAPGQTSGRGAIAGLVCDPAGRPPINASVTVETEATHVPR